MNLTEELFFQLLRMYRMKSVGTLSEFLEGETSTLFYLSDLDGGINPSVLSLEMRLSRARMAQILTALQKKGYVYQETATDDRRKTLVRLTEEGRALIMGKRDAVERYFELLATKLGTDKTEQLVGLLTDIVDLMEGTAL